MADATAPLSVPPTATSWPAVAALALHYAAGGGVLGLIAYLVIIGKVDSSILIALVSAAGGGMGIKLGGKPNA